MPFLFFFQEYEICRRAMLKKLLKEMSSAGGRGTSGRPLSSLRLEPIVIGLDVNNRITPEGAERGTRVCYSPVQTRAFLLYSFPCLPPVSTTTENLRRCCGRWRLFWKKTVLRLSLRHTGAQRRPSRILIKTSQRSMT